MATCHILVPITLGLCNRHLQYILTAMPLDWLPINQHRLRLAVGVQIT